VDYKPGLTTFHPFSVFIWDELHLQARIAVLVMEAVSISETSVNFYQITQARHPRK
jgi:hypothetical protein